MRGTVAKRIRRFVHAEIVLRETRRMSRADPRDVRRWYRALKHSYSRGERW